VTDPLVVRNDERSRYDIVVDDRVVGHTDFRVDGDRHVFVHTEIDPAYRGRDLAERLVTAALDDAREAGVRVVPSCPYVAQFIEQHPEYADLVTA
jgi:predicted GNAT family acetyltransferase